MCRAGGAPHQPLGPGTSLHSKTVSKNLTNPPIFQQKDPGANHWVFHRKKHLWLKKCVWSRCREHTARLEVPAASCLPLPSAEIPPAGRDCRKRRVWPRAVPWGCLWGCFHRAGTCPGHGLWRDGGDGDGGVGDGSAVSFALPFSGGGWICHTRSPLPSATSHGPADHPVWRGAEFLPTSGQLLLPGSGSLSPQGPSAAARL